jgi:energy-converting hydrogenase Eha subunit C
MQEKTIRTLTAPGLLVSIWTVMISIAGESGYSMGEAAQSFWFVTCILVAAYMLATYNQGVFRFAALGVPLAIACIAMLPWIYRGTATFPGTWFWDGWAYLAFGQAFLKYPLSTHLPVVVSPMYELGINLFNTRFITAGLLALFSATPFSSGETQASSAYLLFIYVFTFACSSTVLGTVIFPKRPMVVWAYTVFATLSGYITTMLHANNYDQLLSLAILPLIVAMAFRLRWARVLDAVTLGAVCAAIGTVYPELAPANLGMPAVVIVWRAWSEEAGRKELIKTIAVGLLTFVLMLSPAIYGLSGFLVRQLHAGATSFEPGKSRPGENYFLQFYRARCAPGALWFLFPPMTSPICKGKFSYLAGAVGAVLSGAALIGARRIPKDMTPILICAVLPFMAGLFMLIDKEYDYAAYKLFAVGFPFWAVLVVSAAAAARATWVKTAVLATFASYFILIGFRLWEIDTAAKFKTTNVFSLPLKSIPSDTIVALKVTDELAYQWASYYLRDDTINTIKGSLEYLPAPHSARPAGRAKYLVTDEAAATCWGSPLSQSEVYYVFKAPEQGECTP